MSIELPDQPVGAVASFPAAVAAAPVAIAADLAAGFQA